MKTNSTGENETQRPQSDQMRPIQFTRNYTMHAEGSVLVICGNTGVICTASVEEEVPRF